MPQNARPSSDDSIGSWTDQAGGAASLFSKLNETVPDDSGYVRTEILFPGKTSTAYATKLGVVSDPGIHTSHKVRYRIERVDPGTFDMTVELRQGYVSEGQQGTLLSQRTEVGIAAAFFEGSFTLSEAEAALITDYADLHLRFVAKRQSTD